MTRLALAAAAFLVSTSAFAGDVYNFRVGGHSIRIEQPRNCDEASCMRISIPGVYESAPSPRKFRRDEDDQVIGSTDNTTSGRPATPTLAAPAPVVAAPVPARSQNNVSLEPANGQAPAPVAAAPVAVREAALPERQPVSSGGLAAPAIVPVSDSPLGVWLTEEKEGKVRIEACGSNLCGYSMDEKTGQNTDKVLMNMKATGAKWSGRIHDPKGGSTYDSTIALKGTDRLRVQGCAFGGMMCGGQTWTRVN